MKQTDYRVIHWHTTGTDMYVIHQAYYDSKGNVKNISDEPIKLEANTPEKLKDLHFHVAAAYLQPIIEGHLYKSSLSDNGVMATLSYLTKHF